MTQPIIKSAEKSELSETHSTLPLNRRSMVMGGALMACGALAIIRQPSSIAKPIDDNKFKSILPATVGPWRSRPSVELVLPPADALSEKLYENLETRIYEGKDLPQIMFVIAYSSIQSDNVHVHRPEVCYPAAGLKIMSNEGLKLTVGNKKIAARFLAADRDGPVEYILYWVRVGKEFPAKWLDQRVEMMIANVAGHLPDGVLVRFSTISNDAAEASATLTNFATQMAGALNSQAKMIFFGTAR